MKTVMISGSRSITQLPEAAIASLGRIASLKFDVIVGDAPGVDVLVQRYLKLIGFDRVTVYYALFNNNNTKPRYALFPTIGISGTYTDRDRYMCQITDYGLAIWDGKSRGTQANIKRVPLTRVILS